MKFSLAWLRDLVDLPEEPATVASRLTAAGLAVEQVEEAGSDTVLDVEVTTNRVDAMNHLGLARELAAIFDRPLRMPDASPPEAAEPAAGAVRVSIADPGCHRYAARVVRGVRIGPSPAWLRARLEAIGGRSINNVVDVTNYVLWELGQPIHAFDFAKVGGREIIVRAARAGEKLVTLDGVERELDLETLVIADAAEPVGLGGVMGGQASEVTEATVEVLIESAHFSPKAVRRTARRLGMHTDASHRFERGSDPEMCAFAASRAATLIRQVAGGEVLAGVVDVRREPDRSWRLQGRLAQARLDRFVGIPVPPADVERWLTRLGFELEREGEDAWRVRVPSWRWYDFQSPRTAAGPGGGVGECWESDLFEEAARLLGLDAIPATLPATRGGDAPPSPAIIRRRQVARHLAACGYAEAIHYAFHDPVDAAKLPALKPGAPVELANPLSERYSVMRRSLLPGLVESARFNQRRGAAAVRLFEIGRVFFARSILHRPASGATPELPEEVEMVGLVAGGSVGSPWQRLAEIDFFDLKGAVEGLAAGFGVEIEARPAVLPGLLEGATAELLSRGEVVGYLGRLAEEEGCPLFVAELALPALGEGPAGLEVEASSRFPGVAADLTLTHGTEVPWAELAAAIEAHRPSILTGFELKDRYQGPGVPEGAVNTTIAFAYGAPDRSLTQEEVNAAHLALANQLESRYGWGSGGSTESGGIER